MHPHENKRLQDRTIIVTGASSGIGAAAARLFAAEGANVVLGARRGDRLTALVEAIAADGGRAAALAGDVRDEAYAAALVAIATEGFGGLDGAFNNAGVVGTLAPVEALSMAEVEETLAVNLTAAFAAARHQIPALRARGAGALVFTSSFVGHTTGLAGMGAYAAAKAGLVGLVRVLAAEHGAEGIRANALLPGGTRTAMAGDDPDVHAYVAGLHALKRMADPMEIARAALFLLSDDASFVTGAAMMVDGGNSITKA
ncbi:SDR family oxidoreductase [Acuticoccus mangrovi]|uniref:SDR family oxidoreductase n=1 Tax=Acuticoccus mangrovi TaxID=2796142 RepID=A0A934MJ02_9HYPH|nr:SDR family oxidoreductase [Acuticoccus mangrovi]MBJ3777746.1 SDR family oxidoreductase [Acuticoccus mangrovi]